jgi:uncharacterized membrane protein
MTEDMSRGVRSRASINGHPLHPMIVPFPIAFLVGTLVTDLVYRATAEPSWAIFSKWLLVAGLVMAAIAAVLGAIDFAGIKRVREGYLGWAHAGGNVVAVVLSLVSLIARWNNPVAGLAGIGLPISIIVTLILVMTGWLGGELVFRRKVGVIEGGDSVHRDARRMHPAE